MCAGGELRSGSQMPGPVDGPRHLRKSPFLSLRFPIYKMRLCPHKHFGYIFSKMLVLTTRP